MIHAFLVEGCCWPGGPDWFRQHQLNPLEPRYLNPTTAPPVPSELHAILATVLQPFLTPSLAMVLDQDPADSSRQDLHDDGDGQAPVSLEQRPAVIQNAAEEAEPEQQQQPQLQPQPQPQPIQGPALEAEVRNSPISSNFIDICVAIRRRRLRARRRWGRVGHFSAHVILRSSSLSSSNFTADQSQPRLLPACGNIVLRTDEPITGTMPGVSLSGWCCAPVLTLL